jgi:hypothetical protein
MVLIASSYRRHREERSDAAIREPAGAPDGVASLAMTAGRRCSAGIASVSRAGFSALAGLGKNRLGLSRSCSASPRGEITFGLGLGTNARGKGHGNVLIEADASRFGLRGRLLLEVSREPKGKAGHNLILLSVAAGRSTALPKRAAPTAI